MAKWKAPWVSSPPIGALFVLQDTLETLSRMTERVSPPPAETANLLTAADHVHDDGDLWSSLPRMIGPHTRQEYRARLRGALDRCRGFN